MLRFLIEGLSWWVAFLYRAQKTPVWRTHDGRVILVTAMSDQHLQNAILLVERQTEPKPPVYPFLIAERCARARLGVHFEYQQREYRLRARYFGHRDGK